jgi:hypothetical protein
MSHDHYKKDVRHLDMIDVYRVIELFEVTHPALQHALKKVLCAGDRGAKDWEKDVQEAIDSLNRALQMRVEDAGAKLMEDEVLLMVHPVIDTQMKAQEQTFGGQQSNKREAILQDPVEWLKRHGRIDLRDLAEPAPQESDDPHAELRKTWKPGQRWQGRLRDSGPLDWSECGESPSWHPSLEYRRHPDDAKEGND